MSIIIKRVADIFAALVALIFLSPLMAGTALLIYIVLGQPVIFRQQRPGLRGKPFVIFKFRSMSEAKDHEGQLLPPARRLTPLGKFLRKTSIDELPEFYNVLRGDMSLVGPRPLRMEYLERYTSRQHRRHEVKPGITGWAQIKGRNLVGWQERLELDIWYVEHGNLWLDFLILLKTPLVVLQGVGITPRGEASMPEFLGSEAKED